MANLNLGSIFLKIDKEIDLSLDLDAKKKVLFLNYFLLKIQITTVALWPCCPVALWPLCPVALWPFFPFSLLPFFPFALLAKAKVYCKSKGFLKPNIVRAKAKVYCTSKGFLKKKRFLETEHCSGKRKGCCHCQGNECRTKLSCRTKKIRLPLAQTQKQSRFINKGCLVSLCDSFSTQALQGSQGKTETKIQDIKYPMGVAGLVFPYPSYPLCICSDFCSNKNKNEMKSK